MNLRYMHYNYSHYPISSIVLNPMNLKAGSATIQQQSAPTSSPQTCQLHIIIA
jgi:hypothetical protein